MQSGCRRAAAAATVEPQPAAAAAAVCGGEVIAVGTNEQARLRNEKVKRKSFCVKKQALL